MSISTPIRNTEDFISFFIIVLFAGPFAVILAPSALLFALVFFPIRNTYVYFKPDYTTALINGYKRPIIGLHLCSKCSILRRWPAGRRMRHHDDLESLEASAAGHCWLCRVIYAELMTTTQHRDDPPEVTWPEELDRPKLILWFAERTETRSGFLDSMRGKGYVKFVYGRHPRKLQHDLSSEASFAIVKEWIGTCDTHHRCYQGDQATLSSRVIDVSQEVIHLFIPKGQRAPYITLSHCWGGEQPLTTNSTTLDERIAKIPMESLPALYRDAITITRKLGIKYLWIDSLCILQDVKDDWSREAAKMGDIYRFSYLTIYALSAPNCHQGLLIQRPSISTPISPCSDDIKSDERERGEIFKDAPLTQRAWAVQERLLSPRLLFYSKEEMFWECLACTAREGSYRITPYKSSFYNYDKYECPKVRIPLVVPLGDNPSFPVSLPSDWNIIMAEYTRCRLTRRSDKLPALSGLASLFQRNTEYTYIAGIWEEDFANGLLWFCPIEQPQDQQEYQIQSSKCAADPYRGPSWSWLSTDLAVRNKPRGKTNSLMFYHGTLTDVKLIKSNIQLAGPDPMGEILSATLTIKSSFYKISFESQPSSRRCTIYNSAGEKFGKGILDASDENYGTRNQCAAIWIAQKMHEECRVRTFVTYLLIVVPAPDAAEKDCWKRIGLAWSLKYIALAPELSVINLV